MQEKQKRVICTPLAFVAVVLAVLGMLFGLSQHKGIEGPGGMLDFSWIVAPLTAAIIGGPISVGLSIAALIRREPYSLLTLMILIPMGGIALVIFAFLTQ